MANLSAYIFHFSDKGNVICIAHAKWARIRAGDEIVEAYSNQPVHIAYAYASLERRKPVYCSRIDGAIYYFDNTGRVILDKPHYLDFMKDLDEAAVDAIDL